MIYLSRLTVALALAGLCLSLASTAEASKYTPASAKARGKVCRERASAQKLKGAERTAYHTYCMRYPMSR